jgi:hypothetical protein
MYQTSRARRLATRSQPHGALRNSGRARRAPAVYARDYRGHAPAGCGACPPLLSALVVKPLVIATLHVIATCRSRAGRAGCRHGLVRTATSSCEQRAAGTRPVAAVWAPMSAPDIHALASSASLSQIRLALASGVEVTTPGPVRALPRIIIIIIIIIQNDVSGHQRAVCLS